MIGRGQRNGAFYGIGLTYAAIDAGLEPIAHEAETGASSPKETIMSLYETDFYTWAMRQAERIRSGDIDPVELENIAEEIESLGREQASKLRSSYRLIAMHLLKLLYQPTLATQSWRQTIIRERLNIETVLDDSPGLKSRRQELFVKGYMAARREASGETGLPLATFPIDPPFTAEQAEDPSFMP